MILFKLFIFVLFLTLITFVHASSYEDNYSEYDYELDLSYNRVCSFNYNKADKPYNPIDSLYKDFLSFKKLLTPNLLVKIDDNTELKTSVKFKNLVVFDRIELKYTLCF